VNLKSKRFIKFFMLLFAIGVIETLYIAQTQTLSMADIQLKQGFVSLTGLPDLAISSEASFVRHRSLSSIFDIYRDGEGLKSYFPSSSTYWHSNIVNQTPSKVIP